MKLDACVCLGKDENLCCDISLEISWESAPAERRIPDCVQKQPHYIYIFIIHRHMHQHTHSSLSPCIQIEIVLHSFLIRISVNGLRLWAGGGHSVPSVKGNKLYSCTNSPSCCDQMVWSKRAGNWNALRVMRGNSDTTIHGQGSCSLSISPLQAPSEVGCTRSADVHSELAQAHIHPRTYIHRGSSQM